MKTATATAESTHEVNVVTLSVKVPTLPRFVRILADGKEVGMVSIQSMTEPQLRQLGESWTKALIALADKLRSNKQ